MNPIPEDRPRISKTPFVASLDPKPRRGLRRVDAAAYIGVSPSKFDELVRDDRMPKPFRVDKCTIWDIRELDLAFEALKEDDSQGEDTWAGVA